MFSKCQFLLKDSLLIFCGNPHGVAVNSEYFQELRWTRNTLGLCEHLPHFLSSEIWPPNVELSFHSVHCSYQHLSCIADVSEELILRQSMARWFLSAAAWYSSTWIHIGVKRISQGCCLHHLKNMIQFWDNFKWNLENFKKCPWGWFSEDKDWNTKSQLWEKKISNSLTEKELCAPIMLTSTSKISKNAGGTGPRKDMDKKNKPTILNPMKIILGEWVTT